MLVLIKEKMVMITKEQEKIIARVMASMGRECGFVASDLRDIIKLNNERQGNASL